MEQNPDREEIDGPAKGVTGETDAEDAIESNDREEAKPSSISKGSGQEAEREDHSELGQSEVVGGEYPPEDGDSRKGNGPIEEKDQSLPDETLAAERAEESTRSSEAIDTTSPSMQAGPREGESERATSNDLPDKDRAVQEGRDLSEGSRSQKTLDAFQKTLEQDDKGYGSGDVAEVRLRERSAANGSMEQTEHRSDMTEDVKGKLAPEQEVPRMDQAKEYSDAKGSTAHLNGEGRASPNPDRLHRQQEPRSEPPGSEKDWSRENVPEKLEPQTIQTKSEADRIAGYEARPNEALAVPSVSDSNANQLSSVEKQRPLTTHGQDAGDHILGTITPMAHLDRDRNIISFQLWRPTIEKQTGVTFEQGKLYEIRGRVNGKYDFKVEHMVGDNRGFSVSLSREDGKHVTPGMKHDLIIDHIAEKRQFEVISRPEPVLTIPMRSLESAGISFDKSDSRSRIIRFEMQNRSQADRGPERYFGTYVTSQKSIRLYVGDRDAKVGDRFDLLRAREYTNADFAKDFNAHLGKETQNASLMVKGEELALQVDGKEFHISEHRLTTYHLQAGLYARFDGAKGDVRFWFDGKGIRPVYESRDRILGFQTSEHKLWMIYEDGKSLVYTKYLASSEESKLQEPAKLAMELPKRKLDRISQPRSLGGIYDYSVVRFHDRTWDRQILYIPKEVLKAKNIDPVKVSGSSENVIETRLRNISQPEGSSGLYYGRVTPSKGHVGLPMGKRGWKEGEKFEFLDLREYTLPNFISDFNSRSKTTLNTVLALDDKILSMHVDGTKYGFDQYRFLAFDCEVVLKARSNQMKDEIRFWFDGNDVRATYGNQYSILNFDNSRYGLLLNHHLPEGHRTTSFTEFNPELAVQKLDRSQIIEKLKLIDKPISLEGTYSFEADSSLQTYVTRRLMMTEGTGKHRIEKGRLGEEVSTAVLTIAGCEEFQNHPKNKRSENSASRLDIPDSLILHKDSKAMYFFEFKWVKNTETRNEEGISPS